jgi:hypothetical protein
MSKQQPPLKRIYASIIIAFGWLLFLALWLFYYATGFSVLQNIAIFLVSIVVAAILQILLWVPWSMKQATYELSATRKKNGSKIHAIVKKDWRGRGIDFYTSPTGSVERKVLLDALKDLVVYIFRLYGENDCFVQLCE